MTIVTGDCLGARVCYAVAPSGKPINKQKRALSMLAWRSLVIRSMAARGLVGQFWAEQAAKVFTQEFYLSSWFYVRPLSVVQYLIESNC